MEWDNVQNSPWVDTKPVGHGRLSIGVGELQIGVGELKPRGAFNGHELAIWR